MDVVIIGTGNTATILGRKLKVAGHHILQVYGRDAYPANALANHLNSVAINKLSDVILSAEIYLIAVNDAAIEEIANTLDLPDKIVIHTAASLSKDVLSHSSKYYGVFYPLQSLRKDINHIPDIPILIDASDNNTLKKLEDLANSISSQVLTANEEDRIKLHLAAVFCNNFVNHIYALMDDYCRKQNLDFRLLFPLLEETAVRIKTISPKESQTGPAIRNDDETINKHLKMLEAYPDLLNIYQLMTNSIRSTR